jgi:hypothetical protein
VTRLWLALTEERPDNATAVADVEDSGHPAGFLAAWEQAAKPRRDALRADPRLVDPNGEPASVSLVLTPDGIRWPFDDLAVQQARRALLREPPFEGVSALMRDASHFYGSILVARGPDSLDRLGDDPFARVFPARVLRVGPGLLGHAPAPAGPSIERYGSSTPWPADRFEEQAQ